MGSPGDIRRLTMRELSTNELDTVIGGTVSYPGVYLQEVSANLISIPGVSTSTAGRQTYVVYQNKAPFHHKVL
jgi:bacteriocin-like protein